MSQVSRNAREMKKYLEQHGWIQGQMELLHTPEGENVCLVGSVKYSQGFNFGSINWPELPIVRAIVDYTGYREIAEWNDEEGRTKQEVLDMLENVAIKYDDDAMTVRGNNDDTV